MRVSHVMVEIEKRLSDGNYGSEKATVQYVAQVEDGDGPRGPFGCDGPNHPSHGDGCRSVAGGAGR